MKNNLGKGENAGYQHFLLFPKCFINKSDIKNCLGKVESNLGKEENAGHQHFLLFPEMFSN